MGDNQRITFAGASGAELVGRLHAPHGAAAYALFAHCFTCSKDIKAAVRVSRALASKGIATLRFDFTGIGESEGDFADTSFSSNVQDLVAAAAYLRSAHRAPVLLIGHSLGGAAILAAAQQIPEAAAVATIGAPFDPEHVRRLFVDAAARIEQDGVAEVAIAGRTFRIKQQFLDDLATHCSAEKIGALGKALAVFHSPQDNIVGIDNAAKIYQAARHPKSFISLDGADHLLQREADARYVADVLAAWASRYLPERAEEATEPRRVVVAGGSRGFRQSVQVGPHRLSADEPLSVGGEDSGPTPYELLLAGLGACTSMTMRMYAERKKWPLDGVTVRLSHDKIHAADCESCETKVGKIDDIEREISIEGVLDDEQRARLMEIADKCPVHRTLHSEVRIRSRLAE
jgi:putative redox protein